MECAQEQGAGEENYEMETVENEEHEEPQNAEEQTQTSGPAGLSAQEEEDKKEKFLKVAFDKHKQRILESMFNLFKSIQQDFEDEQLLSE